MANILTFLIYVAPFLLVLAVAGWLADNTKLFDKLLKYFEEV